MNQITSVKELPNSFQALLWGPPGCGKTTLACTAPGRKLIINFDPNGPASVAFRDDVDVLDLSGEKPEIVQEFKKHDVLGISKSLHPYSTVIVDSLSSIQEMTTRYGVDFANSMRTRSQIENPGLMAYGARNALMLELVRNILSLCVREEKHIIFIAHEGSADRDENNSITNIPILLGGQLPTNVSVKLSEIWPMYDLEGGKKKTIAIRPARMRSVAKSRMFLTNGSPEFTWNFDPEKPDEEQLNMTIAGWYQQWIENEKHKIPLPK